MSRRRNNIVESSWSAIGGEWPADIEGASGEKRLAYGLLRGAVETVILMKDGHEEHPDIEGLSIKEDYWDARSWLFCDSFETDGMSVDLVCETVGVCKKDLRTLLRTAGI